MKKLDAKFFAEKEIEEEVEEEVDFDEAELI